MKIKVEFIHPHTGELEEIIMEGPEMDPADLKEIVLDVLAQEEGEELPEGFDVKITEIPSGTIHQKLTVPKQQYIIHNIGDYYG